MEIEDMPTLWCGADDSNHAGDSRGEFIVVTFSTIRGDSIVKPFSNRRNYEETEKWLEDPLRDYRFTILPTEKYRNRGDNVPYIAPYMVYYYLVSKGLNYSKINLYLDGRLECRRRRLIRDFLYEFSGAKEVVVDNFIKKKHGASFRKGYFCPEVVYRADNIANRFTRENKPVMELLRHEKLVPLDSLLNF